MPSQLMKKIFPGFHRNAGHEDDQASTMSRRSSMTLVNPDSSSIRSPSPPPALYQSEHRDGLSGRPQSSVQTNKAAALLDKIDQEDPATAAPMEPCLQICPHETLSFERMQRILNLPNFKSSPLGINAIGGTPVENHSRRYPGKPWICRPTTSKTDWFEGRFTLRYLSSHLASGGDSPGLKLLAEWQIDVMSIAKPETFTQMLEKLDFSLCSHRTSSDPWILQAIFMVMHPDKAPTDPIDEWLARENPVQGRPEHRQDCSHCRTKFTVSGSENLPKLKVTRYLGEGDWKFDPIWLAQCGVRLRKV